MTTETTQLTGSPVTLITGGGSGIGAAVARQLLALGHRVTITGRGHERLAAFAGELGKPAELMTIAGDAADHTVVRSVVEATLAEFGRLDNAVANAGYATFDGLSGGDPARWRDMVLTNVLGPALLINATLPALRRTRGRVVLVGSVAGHVYSADNIYGATKWAVTALAENTRLQVTREGVGVTLISPGAVLTPFWDGDPDGVPQRDFLTADQLAASVVWAITQPAGVDVNTMIVRPVGQPI